VRKKLTVAKVVDKIESPQAGDKAYQVKKKIKRLVVAQFTYNQGFNQFTKNLQEKLFTDLVQKGMQVVERDQLERVLKEQKLGYSGLINLNSAKKVGELLGAEGMVLGTISDLGNSVSINARLVDLETGNSLAAAEVDLPKTPLISDLLNEEVEVDPSFAVAAKPKGRSVKKAKKALEVNGFTFSLQLYKRAGETVTLYFLVTNNEKDKKLRLYAGTGSRSSRMFDDMGNEYHASQVKFGNEISSGNIWKQLPTGVSVKASLKFEKVSPMANSIALLEIGANGFKAQIRNIPFSK
jgi:TolB-like protein